MIPRAVEAGELSGDVSIGCFQGWIGYKLRQRDRTMGCWFERIHGKILIAFFWGTMKVIILVEAILGDTLEPRFRSHCDWLLLWLDVARSWDMIRGVVSD